MKTGKNRKSQRRGSSGFSMVELLIAMVVLIIGLLGGMILIITAIASNARNRFDTAAVALAQSTADRIIALSTAATTQQSQMTDCNGNTYTINTAAGAPSGGAPLTDLSGLANGAQSIDFTQAPVAGYQMYYTLCATGTGVFAVPQVYDVRWNIQQLNAPSQFEIVQVAAKNVTEAGNGLQGQSKFFSVPITLRAVRGN